MEPTRLAEGLRVLRSWGNPVELASNLRDCDGYLAGSDDARLDGLTDLLDRGVRTFIAARGGYGATRLMARLPWQTLVSEGVRFVGFSDLSAILNPLAPEVVQVHGPMVAAGLSRPANERRLQDLLCGRFVGQRLFSISDGMVVRHGRTDGRALGGNLSLLTVFDRYALGAEFRRRRSLSRRGRRVPVPA